MQKDQFVQLNGVDLFYTDEGSGQPLIFVHGSLGTHAVWKPYYDQLKGEYRTLAYDLRGHGKSVFEQSQFTFENCIQDLIAFIEVLELENVYLCGWSAGGNIALQTALEIPNRVSKLIVGGVTLRESDAQKQTLMAMGLDADGSLNLERAKKAIPHLIENWKTVHTQSEDHWQRLLNQMGSSMLNPPAFDFDNVAAIHTETLILWGDRDQFLPVADATELYELLPNSQLAIIPNSDHFVTRTHVDYVYSLIKTFLS